MQIRPQQVWRISWLLIAFLLAFAALEVRMAYIQVVKGPQYAAAAARAHSQIVPGEQFPRGNILDRYGRVLSDPGERMGVVMFPGMVKDYENTARQLERMLGISTARAQSSQPFIVRSGLNPSEVAALTAARLPGVYLLPVDDRYGPDALATHLVGYIGKIDSRTWEKLKASGKTVETATNDQKVYRRDDVIGVKGIEAQYEDFLKALEPRYLWSATVDARGNMVSGLGFNRVVNPPGDTGRADVVLTVDRDIQELVERAMDRGVPRGAVVVLDVATGEVLAMASRPDYNQGWPADTLEPGRAPDNPFLNRALEHYFPGSIFKTVVAAAALEEGLVTPQEKFVCSGAYVFDTGLSISCWKKEGHGELTFQEALAVSCNPTFIEVGLRLGRERLLKYAGRFGLDKDTLIGYQLPAGPAPISIDRYGPGKVANASLGQEGVRLTPLQVAGIMATVARGGQHLSPKIVREVVDSQGKVIKEFNSAAPVRAISPETSALLKQMLESVTTGGTGREAWVTGWGSAGKTSSAESGSIDQAGQSITNAWFAGYAPLVNPRYALAVLVEGGPSGGSAAAPVFRVIIEGIRELEARRAANLSPSAR
ncbi:hypothetical protein SY88_19810 [Clostridiales bacterium PH28_bin88]|nr:hypothetical protein SY88_19810 [Clostridiales bacterium PH28_bin88]